MFSINRVIRRGRGCAAGVLYIPLCFLLIEQHGMNTVLRRVTLHSTMFSINLSAADHIQLWRGALHSTMFSINPALVPQHFQGKPTLHSTMFSINRRAESQTVHFHRPLHSTMFSINPEPLLSWERSTG